MKTIAQLCKAAENAYHEGDARVAEKILLQALKADPENAEAANNLGVLRHAQGRLDEALQYFERALSADPTYGEAVYNAALAYAQSARAAAAFAVLLHGIDQPTVSRELATVLEEVTGYLLNDFVGRDFDTGWPAREAIRELDRSRLQKSLGRFQDRFPGLLPLGQKLELLSAVWLLLGEDDKASVSLRQLALHRSDARLHHLALARVYTDSLRVYDAHFAVQLSRARFDEDKTLQRIAGRVDELLNAPEAASKYRSMLVAMDGGSESVSYLLPVLERVKKILPECEITLLGEEKALNVAQGNTSVSRTITKPDDRRYDIGFESVHWANLREKFGDYGHRICRTFYTIYPMAEKTREAEQHMALASFFLPGRRETETTRPISRTEARNLDLVARDYAEHELVREHNRLFLHKDGRREPLTIHLVGARISNFPWGMENEVYRALEKAGVRILDTDFRRDHSNLADLLKKPAHLLWVIKGNGIPPQLIREFPGKSILWYQDDVFATAHARRQLEHNAHAFDTVYSFDASALDEYRKFGVRDPRWLPLAMSPSVHRKLFLSKKHDIVFVGNVYPQRERLLQRLQHRFGLVVAQSYMDDMVRLFNEAKIVLNIGVGRTGIQARVFEALGCGSFLLSNEIPEETKLFEGGRDLVYFDEDNIEDLIEQYLANDAEREEIAQNGYLEAHAHHTFDHRVAEVLDQQWKVDPGAHLDPGRIRISRHAVKGGDPAAGPRILVVGFDGMEANILLDNLDQFPTFKSLLEESSWGVLEVTPCPGTLEGWASIYTGAAPPKHGMDEVGWKSGGGRIEDFPKFTDLRVKTIWEHLGEQARTSGCFNIPFVHYVPQRTNRNVRYIVPGYFVPPHIASFPRQVSRLLQGYPSEQGSIISHKPHVPPEEWSNANGEHRRRLKEQYVREAMGRDLKRLEYCRRLFEEYNPDFSFNVFHETDRIGHFVLDYIDLMVEGYRVADQILASMMELDYDYLIVVSDHGMWYYDSDLCKRTVSVTGRSEYASGGYRLANCTHSAHAVFIVQGEGIATGRRIDGSLYDVAPTICRLAGVPIPDHVDGRVLEEVFAGQVLDEEEQAHLKEQLAGLGYI